jgi:ankyrin repeat protein
MNSIENKQTPNGVRSALENLPTELDKTYEEAMNRIKSQIPEDKELAEKALCWVSYALRPMSVGALLHAIAVVPGQGKLVKGDITREEIVISVCAGLLSIDHQSKIVRLIHFTTQEYFDRHLLTWFPNLHKKIATTCLTYISFKVFSTGPCSSDREMDKRLHQYPLFRYAAQHWGDHVGQGSEGEIEELALQFLQTDSKLKSANQAAYLSEIRHTNDSQQFPKDVTGLQVAASFGLAEIAKKLLEKLADVNAKDGHGKTALHRAAENGHERVIQVLLSKEAKVNMKDDNGQTALHQAAANGHVQATGVLLEGRSGLTIKDIYGWNVLHNAATNGHKEVARLLLENGADIEAKGNYGWTALHCAARYGHKRVTRLLLKWKADVEAKDEIGDTVLFSAVRNGHLEAARLLVQHGANRWATGRRGHRPLEEAVLLGHGKLTDLWASGAVTSKERDDSSDEDEDEDEEDDEEDEGEEVFNPHTVMELLKNGTDINARDESGCTLLEKAANKGDEGMVRLILEKGADVALKDSHGRTALYFAAAKGHMMVVQLLLEEGADIGVRSDYSKQTVLQCAAMHGHKATVRLLLEKGANVNGKYSDGQKLEKSSGPSLFRRFRGMTGERTALHFASGSGHQGVVQLLLEKGADIEAKGFGKTPLHEAVENGHVPVVQLLLANGAAITATDENVRWTPLHWAAAMGHEETVRVLLENGADTTAKDRYHFGDGHAFTCESGGRPLHWAARKGHQEVAQLLLEHGADIAARDDNGCTALHRAAQLGHEGVVTLLLWKKADITAKEGCGMTPLHHVAERQHEGVTLLLEEAERANKSDFTRPAQHWTPATGFEAVARLLLERGADVSVKDGLGRTPLDAAREGPCI